MVAAYVNRTKDTDILDRAIPLAEKELAWWSTNRTTTVESPNSNASHTVFRYAVVNSAPRPEVRPSDLCIRSETHVVLLWLVWRSRIWKIT